MLKELENWAESQNLTLNWRPLVDDGQTGFWSDVLSRASAVERKRPQQIFAELNLADRAELSVTQGGGLVWTPGALTRSTVKELCLDASNEGSSSIWLAQCYDAERPLSSLRLFAQAWLHARLLAGQGHQVCGLISGRESVEQLNSLVVEYLEKYSVDWGSRQNFRYIWTDSFDKAKYRALRAEDKESQVIAIRRELLLPIDKEVSVDEFINKDAVENLLLHLARPTAGQDMVPWCAIFNEEANLPWALNQLLQRLNLRLIGKSQKDFLISDDNSLVLEGESGRFVFFLLTLELFESRAIAAGEVALYLGAIQELVRLGHKHIDESPGLLFLAVQRLEHVLKTVCGCSLHENAVSSD